MSKHDSKSVRITGIVIPAITLALLFCKRSCFTESARGILVLCLILASSLLYFLISTFKIELSEKKGKIFAFLFLLGMPMVNLCIVELLNGNLPWEIAYYDVFWANYAINLLLYLAVYGASGSLRLAGDTITLLLDVFGITNFYVKQFKGSPLLPWDIGSIRTAANVAGKFTYAIGYEILFAVAITFLIFRIGYCLPRRKTRTRIYKTLRITSLAVCLFVLTVFYKTSFVASVWDCSPDFFNQTRGYETNGSVMEFFLNTKYMSLNKPAGYDPDTVTQTVTETAANCDTTIMESNFLHAYGMSSSDAKEASRGEHPENPNIICIMDEAFSDLRVIGDFETDKDVMPYIDSLNGQENVISGYAYVSTFGTGTSNTEYEFLTGNSMAFLPLGSNAYQLYIDHEQPGLTMSLKDTGYQTEALHPYNRSSWNRPAVYDYMGFDTFTARDNLYSPDMLRGYVSDDYDFRKLIEMYEARDKNKPFFMFNVTMQNHSSYDQEWDEEEESIHLKGLNGDYPLTEQYLSCVHQTDESFRKLIDYFANTDEPTILLFWGDHQPFIENGFYEEVMGKPLKDLSDAENQKRYITRFVLWANYDIPEEWFDKISVNYLSSLLLENTGLEMTDYDRFREAMFDKMPVITAYGCYDSEGNFFKESNPLKSIKNDFDTYRCAAYYDITADEKRSKIFTLQKAE